MSSAAKVGIFMLVILGILGFFVLKIQRISVGGGPTKKVSAVFDSVAGLDKKSKVRIAGVEVGDVTDIRLRPDGKAEVTMEIARSVELHRGAFARVVNMGLLGEKYVEIVPGKDALVHVSQISDPPPSRPDIRRPPPRAQRSSRKAAAPPTRRSRLRLRRALRRP